MVVDQAGWFSEVLAEKGCAFSLRAGGTLLSGTDREQCGPAGPTPVRRRDRLGGQCRSRGTLDLIIVDSTDPVGPAVGLFTQGFFESCLRALAPGGMVIQQSESPLLHMDILRQMYADLRGAGFADVKTLFFSQAVYPSGWWSATMARKAEAIGGFREEAVERRPFATRYYNADIHRAALAQPEFFRREIAAAG